MAQLAVLIAGLLLIAESHASDVAEADQAFLSKYMTAPTQRSWTSVIDDKPALHQAPQMQDSYAFTSAKEVANGSNTPITLSAIGVGLLALVTMLGVRMRRGMQPAAVLAGMEMQSQAQVSAVPNIFYSGGDDAKLGAGGMADTRDPEPFVNETDKRQSISQAPSFEEYLKSRQFAADSRKAELKHGLFSMLAASRLPLQATLKAEPNRREVNWDPLDLLPVDPTCGWQPAVFAVEPWSEKNIRLTLPLAIGLPLAGIVTPPDSPIASVLPVAIAGLWIFIFIDLLKAAVPEDDFDF
jgi:hypothetical protein